MKIAKIRRLKVRLGANIIAYLLLGAISVTLSNPSARATESQLQLLASSSACTVVHGTGPHSVRATTSDCYRAQARVYCSDGYWYFGLASKDSRAFCRDGFYAMRGGKRAQATSTSPWWDWAYFNI